MKDKRVFFAAKFSRKNDKKRSLNFHGEKIAKGLSSLNPRADVSRETICIDNFTTIRKNAVVATKIENRPIEKSCKKL